VDILIRQNFGQQRHENEITQSAILHNNFDELQTCAHKCHICRVFRQAIVFEEVTFDGLKAFQKTEGQVIVRWRTSTTAQGSTSSFLTVEIEGGRTKSGIINCTSQSNIEHLSLRPNALSSIVIKQARGWLDDCLANHVGQCDNLRWNSENPQLLVEIMSPTSIRLCENKTDDYVALSYCWGKETDEVKRGKTLTTNLQRRHQEFSITELPNTVRDALGIIHAMGLRYAWIDTLCIVQDDPKGVTTMHKVYSNALFTLCACATRQATEKLINQREAWTEVTEPCRLGGQFLTTTDMSLNELRLRSPLADRAWTLQEERLSPRMLYVSSSRMYWSCGKGHEMEMKPTYGELTTPLHRPMYAVSDRNAAMPIAQEFLWACYSGEQNLHKYWTDMVTSYAMRDMGKKSDRLKALSGLAAKYLSASSCDRYLAGLWAKDLAEGLSWRVKQPVEIDTSKIDPENVAPPLPSWSWAILPLQTAINFDGKSMKSPDFEWIQDDSIGGAIVGDAAEQAIEVGGRVGRLCVTGRIRSLWKSTSRFIEWSEISRSAKGEEKFSFADNLERDLHAVHYQTGRVLVHENRKREVIGQLDFRRDVESLQSEWLGMSALQVGSSSMLLLQHCSDGTWRRVGVAWDVREDYFASARKETLILA
jgi:hypothetical protein